MDYIRFSNPKMNRVFVILIVSSLSLTPYFSSCDRCCQINSRQLPYYKLVHSNVRSNQLILSRKTVKNVNECREFALAKKALAFNYGREPDFREWDHDTRKKNSGSAVKMCQALQCPEIFNSSTFVRDNNYAYYSMYTPNFNGINVTLICIPRTGVFAFSNDNLNYSQAQISCQKMNASLAHVISEERTSGLTKHLSQNTPAFVGLSNRDEENIWKNEFDEPLFCFKYRSWGKGQPAHSKGCVTLVQPRESKTVSFWEVVTCNSTLPFICEVSPVYRYRDN